MADVWKTEGDIIKMDVTIGLEYDCIQWLKFIKHVVTVCDFISIHSVTLVGSSLFNLSAPELFF